MFDNQFYDYRGSEDTEKYSEHPDVGKKLFK